ncbi:MAG TPA: hypothetical protein PLD59_08660 [Tepidisphaeraceae bacterium]|nr:hypothetical protein [Tepidisphaeraceae bacterium]
MPEVDFFHFFRKGVGWIATVYATVVMLQSLYGWWVYLAAGDRYTSLMRRYLLVQAVRLRFWRFAGDLAVCVLLCVAFLIIWRAHYTIYGIETALADGPRTTQTK